MFQMYHRYTVHAYRYICRKQKFTGEAAVSLAVSKKKPISRINDNLHKRKLRIS